MNRISLLLFLLGLSLYSGFAQAEDCIDKDKIYKVCSAQDKFFDRSMKEAIQHNKMVLVKFGADWCPWCRALHKMFKKKEFWQELNHSLVLSEVGVSHYKTRKRVQSGRGILQNLLIANKKSEGIIDGYPFLAVVRPKDRKTIFINTGALEDNSKGKGHDPKKVKAAIKAALKDLKI